MILQTKGIPEDIVINKTGEVLYGHNHYYDIDFDENGIPDWKNNYLVYDLKNNRVYFDLVINQVHILRT